MSTLELSRKVVRLSEPDLGPEVEALVLEVLRSGQLAQGPHGRLL